MNAPCGKVCADCPIFGTSCDGCEREMSFSFAYRCRAYDRSLPQEAMQCTGTPCKVVNGESCLCPLVVQKSLRPISSGATGSNSPVE